MANGLGPQPFPPTGGGSGGIVERTVGDQVFSDVVALINWSNANLDQLRNNNDVITNLNPWNRSVAQVGPSNSIQIYQWDGDNLPSSFPTESAWTLRDRVQTDQEIVDAIGRVNNVNLVNDAEKAHVDALEAVTTGTIPQKTSTGYQNSPLSMGSTMLESTRPLKLPGGGALQFDNNDMSSGGTVSGGAAGVRFTNLSDDTSGYLISVPFDETNGSDRPFYDRFNNVLTIPIQSPAGTDTRNAEFDFINDNDGIVKQYQVRRPAGSATLNDCNFIIWLEGYNTGTPLFDYKESHPQGLGFTLQAGVNTVVPPVPIGFPANENPSAPASEQVRLYSHVVDSQGNLIELVGSVQDYPSPPDPRSESVWIPDLGRVLHLNNKTEVADLTDTQRPFVSVSSNQTYTTRDQIKPIINSRFSFTAAATVTVGNALGFNDGQTFELHGNGGAGTFALTGIAIEGQANYTVANGDRVIIHIDDASTNTARVESLDRTQTSTNAARAYNGTEYRRANFTLDFGESDTDAPGNLYRVEQTATVTLPASTSDDQLGLHWGFQNPVFNNTVTFTPDTPTGHTVILEGFSRPYDMPSGTSIDIVLVDRTATTTTYRIMNQSNGIEGLMNTLNIGGTSINIFGISGRPVHYLASHTSTGNYTMNIAGVGLLPRGESCRALIENTETSDGLNLMVPSGTQFKGTNTRIICIPPESSIWITITNDRNTGVMEVDVDGPVYYEFMIESHDITNTGDNKGDWTGVPSYLSDIIFSPTLLAERDRLEAATDAGFMLEFNLMGILGHGSSNTADSSLITIRGDVNDGNPFGPGGTRRVRGGDFQNPDINRTWITPMSSGHHFNLSLVGFPLTGAAGPRILDPWAKVKVTMKR